jgi:hypothetical protein
VSPTPLTDLAAFRAALASGRPLVITDRPTRTDRLHAHPADCPGVSEAWFETKVIENRGRTGGYYAVDSEEEAYAEWPGLSECSRCRG